MEPARAWHLCDPRIIGAKFLLGLVPSLRPAAQAGVHSHGIKRCTLPVGVSWNGAGPGLQWANRHGGPRACDADSLVPLRVGSMPLGYMPLTASARQPPSDMMAAGQWAYLTTACGSSLQWSYS